MKIAILGSGNMGRALGARWSQLGHEVMFAARTPEKSAAAASEAGNGATSASMEDAARAAEIVFWSPRDRDPATVLQDPSVLTGKTVIDVANRSMDAVRNGAPFPRPLAAELAAALPSAHVVKAFNTVAMEAFDADPAALRSARAEIPIAGDNVEAKAHVSELAQALGFAVRDLGPLHMSHAIEYMADALRLGMIDGGLGWQVQLAFTDLPAASLGQVGRRQASNYA